MAKEWHPVKNESLKPSDVTVGSGIMVWWLLQYDDPKTGKHFVFEWQASISNRVKGNGCPFLSNKKVWTGFNDLETKYPKLAAQWHPTKNGTLKPSDCLWGSNEIVWWYLPYDDPFTGKHFDFEWPAKICERTRGGTGCPFLANQKVWRGFNDLATTHPELAKEWHPTKNGILTPYDFTAGSGEIVWWYLPYDDFKTGKHFDFEWTSTIKDRASGRNGCPFLSNQKVWRGFNDLATTNPELAAQWHPSKNGILTPYDFTVGSEEIVWWYLSYDDPKSGRHFDFEWTASILHRNHGIGCPFLSNKKVWPGFNDLETNYPELAAQWHPTKNGTLKPSDFSYGSNARVWWYLPYDDPQTGKHFDFEWLEIIKERTGRGYGCPYLFNRRVWPGFNDLETVNPDLAKEWHQTKNIQKANEYTAFSNKKVWWKCSNCGYEWYDAILKRSCGKRCRKCRERDGN